MSEIQRCNSCSLVFARMCLSCGWISLAEANATAELYATLLRQAAKALGKPESGSDWSTMDGEIARLKARVAELEDRIAYCASEAFWR